jgi:hypothetical protein
VPAATLTTPARRWHPLAKPNYSFEKKQRELAKKKEQEAKEARKRAAREAAKAEAAEKATTDPA